MVQLQILSGRQQGTVVPVAGFPFSIGRAGSDKLRVQEAGVWEYHVVIDSEDGSSFEMKARPNASLLLNTAPVEVAALTPGDVVELGGLKLRFELSSPQQRSNRLREVLFWLILLIAWAGQIGAVLWLE